MSLSNIAKAEIISDMQHKLGMKKHNTGATEVQVALLTKRIKELTEHFKIHSKDHHSRYGLLKLVNARRSLLNYLKREDIERYRKLLELLDLRH